MDETNFLTLPEIVAAARRKIPSHLWSYLCGGAESEVTLRRNRLALDSLALRPRILRNVSAIDCTSRLLGLELRIPVVLAPIGALALFDPDGSLAAARAASQFGTVAFVGVLGSPALEVVAARCGGPAIFQLYVRGDRAWIHEMVSRARDAGYRAICLTVDTAIYGRRDRDLINRFFPASAVDRPDVGGVLGAEGDRHQASADWETLAHLCEIAGLPIILKGVMTGEDAEMACAAGVSAVHVSNHGGRQLDHGQATIDVLPEIVAAVSGRAEIIVDSGFMRGSDVVKALALGANAVAIGKLQALALAAGGTAGVVRALELLEQEIRTTMGLLGTAGIGQLGRAVVRPAAPPYGATVTGAFPAVT